MSDEKMSGGSATENASQPDAKRDKSGKDKDYMQIIKSKLLEYRGEFRKIIWLSKKELTKRTITVIVTSVLFAAVIFGMDSFFSILIQNFFLLIGK